jgi:hypothetical protein
MPCEALAAPEPLHSNSNRDWQPPTIRAHQRARSDGTPPLELSRREATSSAYLLRPQKRWQAYNVRCRRSWHNGARQFPPHDSWKYRRHG